MPIWSLTRERIDKLNRQIEDRNQEVEILSSRTIEEIWRIDLDDFINEWRVQLDEEAKIVKKSKGKGRRESKKLKIGGAPSKKRKGAMSDDSDFDAAPKAKKTVSKAEKAVGGLLNYLHQPGDKPKKITKPKAQTASQKTAQSLLDSGMFNTTKESKKVDDDLWMNAGRLDGAAESKADSAAAKKNPAPVVKKGASQDSQGLSDDDFEILVEQPPAVAAAVSRRPRAAATKAIKYNALSDSDSDGEDMLLDVGKMVKGIDTATVSTENSRPLFSSSMSRPGSSSGLPRKSTSVRETMDIDADDTDYTKLAPPTTSKGPAPTARKIVLSDDDDLDSLDDLPASPPKKLSKAARPPKVNGTGANKAASKPKATAVAVSKKPTPAPQAPKSTVLSPAAKAYAAKKAKAAEAAKKKQMEDDDDDDDMDILDDDIAKDSDDEVLVAAPASRPAATTAARPARRAAATVSKKKWAVSDEDDDDEDGGDSASEDDFDNDDDEDESF